MPSVLNPVGLATLVTISLAWALELSEDSPSRRPQGAPAAGSVAEVEGHPRFKPTGLSLSRPYRRGRIPVVFVHGLWLGPSSWATMIDALEADPELDDRYQFWTFGYSTGDPIPYSAWLLRCAIDDVRRKFDPDRSDLAFDRMVIVGHSMGGLLAKMTVQDSGTRLWRLVSDRPFEELAGDPEDLDLFRHALFFSPRSEVRRVIFIATPHRGSPVARGRLGRLGTRLVRLEEPLRASYARLVARNGPVFFEQELREGLPTSIDGLESGSPLLAALSELTLAPEVSAYSIIADLRDPPRPGGGDGVVPYDSAHLDGDSSEILVPSGHLCQGHPDVVREVRRILVDHVLADTSSRPPPGGAL